jgi:hypothetical protein
VRLRGSTYRKIGKVYLSIGFSFTRFALGISLHRNFIDLELGVIWIGVEF